MMMTIMRGCFFAICWWFWLRVINNDYDFDNEYTVDDDVEDDGDGWFICTLCYALHLLLGFVTLFITVWYGV